MQAQNLDSAEILFENMLADPQLRAASDTGFVKTAKTLAEQYAMAGNLAKAVAILDKTLPLAEQAYGEAQPETAVLHNKLGMMMAQSGEIDAALSHFQRALTIFENAGEDWRPMVASAAKNCALCHTARDEFSLAEPLYLRALRIYQVVTDTIDYQIAAIMNNLGGIYIYWGEYARAEPLFEQAMPIMSSSMGTEHPAVVQIVCNRGICTERLGRLDESEQLYRDAIVAYDKIYGEDSDAAGEVLHAIAQLKLVKGELSESDSLYRRAIAVREKTLGKSHNLVGASLQGLARVKMQLGDYDLAAELLDSALAIRTNATAPDHPDVAKVLVDIAKLKIATRQYEEADEVLRRALGIYQNFWGDSHPDVAYTYELMRRNSRNKKNYEQAEYAARRAFEIRHRILLENANMLSERNALIFAGNARQAANGFLSALKDQSPDGKFTERQCADIIMAVKGQIVDQMNRRQQRLRESDNPEVEHLLAAHQAAVAEVSHLTYGQAAVEPDERYLKQLDSLSALVQSCETELARLGLNRDTEAITVTGEPETIASLLPVGAALIEFLRYSYLAPSEENSEDRYLALVSSRNGVQFCGDLGEAAVIDSAVSKFRQHLDAVSSEWPDLSTDRQTEADELLQRLYSLVWSPFAAEIKPNAQLLICPDGAMNLLSFGSLKDDQGKYLVELHPISYLSAGRDLQRIAEPATPGDGLLALGDPDFNSSVSSRLTAIGSMTTVASYTAGSTEPPPILRSSCDFHRGKALPPLKYSAREVDRIASHWRTRFGEEPVVLLQEAASEDNFKSQAGGKQVLHIASHGFFASEDCQSQSDQRLPASISGGLPDNPLLRSGILLAGASRPEEDGAVAIEDGVLTAYEVAGLDLNGVKWVVLSACETGLGDIEAGEGVYGLRRAFELAGVRTVISSLWSVPDKETAGTMDLLYGKEPENLAVAFQQVAISQIRELREREMPDHPYIWAAFVTTGAW
ncbi:MAG: CHAT domain-containing tetratricopeptide repeat protein [bacterium]